MACVLRLVGTAIQSIGKVQLDASISASVHRMLLTSLDCLVFTVRVDLHLILGSLGCHLELWFALFRFGLLRAVALRGRSAK